MNVEEIRQLFRDSTGLACGGLKSCKSCQNFQELILSGSKDIPIVHPCEYDFSDPFYDVLNVAWATLGGNDVPKDVKVGDYTIRLVQVKLTPGEKELNAWNNYKDAECTAVFEVVETGDRFIVSGDNGSWGWGALMETDLSAIYLLNPDEIEIDKAIERSMRAEEFAALAKQLAKAKNEVVRLETELIELKKKLI